LLINTYFKFIKLKQQGNEAFSSGKFKEAVQFYTEALEVDVDDHVLYSNRSAAFASLRQFDEARADAEKCISLNPNFVKGYSRKGLALSGLGQYEEAIEAYEQGLTKDPNNTACKDGLEEAKKLVTQIPNDPNTDAEMRNMWKNARYIAQTHPKLKQYKDDPSFMAMISDVYF
jgi:stress-induced-phosphoprotein 1